MLKFNNKNKSFTQHHFYLKSGAGFTLLEVIITIFVITVGILSACTVVQQIAFYTFRVSSRLTAAYLAKEGIEIVRNIRDTNFLDSVSWNQGLGEGEREAGYNDSSLSQWTDPGNFLNLETGAGFYGYGDGAQTQFKRKITITEIDSEAPIGVIDYLNVSVLIEWKKGDKDFSLTVQENLYNWWYE